MKKLLFIPLLFILLVINSCSNPESLKISDFNINYNKLSNEVLNLYLDNRESFIHHRSFDLPKFNDVMSSEFNIADFPNLQADYSRNGVALPSDIESEISEEMSLYVSSIITYIENASTADDIITFIETESNQIFLNTTLSINEKEIISLMMNSTVYFLNSLEGDYSILIGEDMASGRNDCTSTVVGSAVVGGIIGGISTGIKWGLVGSIFGTPVGGGAAAVAGVVYGTVVGSITGAVTGYFGGVLMGDC